ncbi:MAG: N-acetylmuramic acid 6-phosphate etherase [Actinophytocola sp.]|nr:N-acetylmuramic acid 6-phosphate etherase [Actinophytocola sp.]
MNRNDVDMNHINAELERLETEGIRPDLADLDRWSTAGVVAQIAADDATVAPAVADEAPRIAAAVDAITERMRAGGRLIYVGAGTPGRLAVVDASECVPTFGIDPGMVLAVVAGGSDAVTTAVEGAEDDVVAAAADLRAVGVSAGDAVVGITASGRTPYVLAAMAAASEAGAVTIGVSNNRRTQLSERVDIAIEVVTGPEVIAGSTRMKAGTAQKLVLNTLSTATMIRLGKTHGNLMVDVRATNVKLRARALRIVVAATGVDDNTATAALDRAGGHAKSAITALLAGKEPS